MEQPININKNEHAMAVLKRLDSFRREKKHCDFLIRAGREEIPVHRRVVSACSDYFDAMLSHDTLENRSGVVEMKDIDPGCIRKCVDFMYTGEASVSEDNREQLLHVAHMLQLPRLCNGIALLLEEKLDSTSFFYTKMLAIFYNYERLIRVCNDFALWNFRHIAQLEEFKKLDEDYIQFLFGSKDLKASEGVKCKALIEWIKHDTPSRKKFLVGTIKKLTPSYLPSSYKKFLTENEPLLYTSDECSKWLMISMFESGNVKAADVEIGRNEGIAIFDKVSEKILSYDVCSKTFTALQPMTGLMLFEYFTVVVHEQHLYVLVEGGEFYRIQYSVIGASWEELPHRKLLGFGPAVLLEDVIYTSNSVSAETQSMERYDIALNKWTLLPKKNSLVHLDAVAVTEGKIFCIGGFESDLDVWSQVQKYDPVSSTWSDDSALHTARVGASAATWENGVYVLGGLDQDYNSLSDVEYRCPKSKTWTKLTSMNICRDEFSSVATGGRIYAIGGDENDQKTIEEYDPDSKQWKVIETMTGKRLVPTASATLIT